MRPDTELYVLLKSFRTDTSQVMPTMQANARTKQHQEEGTGQERDRGVESGGILEERVG